MTGANQLSKTSILLHWTVAIPVIGLICTGLYMSNTRAYWLFNYHKSIGVLLFAIAIARVIWRIREGWPTPLSQLRRIEQYLAKAAHWILIIATIGMPVSGMMDSGVGGHGFGIFSWELVPPNHDAERPDVAVPYNNALARLGEIVHKYLGYLLAATVSLHIFAVLKHHVLDRDGTLWRMLGR